MNSIRTKITLLTVCVITVTMVVAATLGVVEIRRIGDRSSRRILSLLCETGEKNLDFYFESVEQSVEMVSSFAEEDLDGLTSEQLESHVERVRGIFEKTAGRTNGALTYYYRIDPAVSDTVKGFWYVRVYGRGFKPHEVTDISLYDTEDTSKLVWFTVPKATGKPIWLPPYITDNLDARVISYNVPIYWENRFIGVIGIEIDYSVMAEPVDSIELYDNGYAFITDEEGRLIYHPRMDVTQMTDETRPAVPEELLTGSKFIRYSFDGVEKIGSWLPLSNGMRLNVAVPVSEINGDWIQLVDETAVVFILLLFVFIIFIMNITDRVVKPLRELTEVAGRVSDGDYDVELTYSGNDEVGILTRSFNQLIRHLKIYISDLNNLAYADALTSVRNKGAFDIYARKLQSQLYESDGDVEFAIGVFDCDDLKLINDRYGHDKGDCYLKNASSLICSVFQHSPVFRTGGDEFTMILQDEEYRNREELARLFEETGDEICASTDEPWEQVRVAKGIAVYDRRMDRSVDDVMRRADKLMYENKFSRKNARKASGG